jgi:hypothetical protein
MNHLAVELRSSLAERNAQDWQRGSPRSPFERAASRACHWEGLAPEAALGNVNREAKVGCFGVQQRHSSGQRVYIPDENPVVHVPSLPCQSTAFEFVEERLKSEAE